MCSYKVLEWVSPKHPPPPSPSNSQGGQKRPVGIVLNKDHDILLISQTADSTFFQGSHRQFKFS